MGVWDGKSSPSAFGGGGFGGGGPDPAEKEYNNVRKAFEKRSQLLDQQYRNETAVRQELANQGVLLDAEFAVQSEAEARKHYNRQLALLGQFAAETATLRSQMKNRSSAEGADDLISTRSESVTSEFERERRMSQLRPLKQMGEDFAVKSIREAMALPLPDVRAAWQVALEEGQKTFKALESDRNSFMEGWIGAGKSMWQEWIQNGKVSMSSLKDLVMKTFADISYRRFLAEPMAKLGEEVFDRVLAPGGKVTGSNSSAEAMKQLKSSFQGLGQVADFLGAKMQSMGNDFWQMLVRAGQGLAAMLQSSGGGGGGLGGFLAGLFGGSSAGGSSGVVNGIIPEVAGMFAAQGATFNGAYHAFAKGGLMNSVVSQPTMFRFGQGGSRLGVMGEAGPEAIMPLARDSSGTLGVRTVGSGSYAAPAPRTIVMIENHGSGADPQVTRQSQPNGDEMIRVVLNAAANDVSRGGPLRKSIKSTLRTSPNLPRY